jgi:hypothetical protein
MKFENKEDLYNTYILKEDLIAWCRENNLPVSGSAETIIPGHGQIGGKELLEHTKILLQKYQKNKLIPEKGIK